MEIGIQDGEMAVQIREANTRCGNGPQWSLKA